MKDRRISVNKECIFVIPVSGVVELLLDYDGLEWSNENINEERLRAFSNNCEGINITFFENENDKFLMFSQEGNLADSIEIYFEGIFMDSLPCAFFDKESKTYDNFVLPSTTTRISVGLRPEEGICIEWEFDDEADSEQDSITDSNIADEDDNILIENERFNNTCELLISENEVLRRKTESLSDNILELEEEIRRLKENTKPVSDPDKDKEISELNRLVRQLADDRYKGLYVETLDSEINSLTASILKQRTLFDKKKESQKKLEQELANVESSNDEIRATISDLMDSIHKAESILQDRSTELSEKQARLENLLADLGIDMDILKMYSIDTSSESILSEANAIKNRLENKLKSLVQERQNECDERSNRIKGSS